MKKKPIGYTAEQRKSMKSLIERTEPKSGDYVGSGTVTTVPKKKKMKRMQMGGVAGTVPMVMPANLNRVARPMMGAPAMARPGMMADRRMMRGGGLAKRGVGMAMAAGGAVRACGVAKRGKSRGKMV